MNLVWYSIVFAGGFILAMIVIAAWESRMFGKKRGCPDCGNEWLNFVGRPGDWSIFCARCGWKDRY